MPNMFRELAIPSAPRVWLPGRATPVTRRVHVVHAWSRQVDARGALVWDEGRWSPNELHDEGEEYILSAAFATSLAGFGAPPANLYLGLDDRSSVALGDTLASLSGEPTGTGYARIAIATTNGFTISKPVNDYQAASATQTFTNSGGSAWTAVLNRFVCTVSSGTGGKLIATIALSVSRTLQAGDSLQTTAVLGLSN